MNYIIISFARPIPMFFYKHCPTQFTPTNDSSRSDAFGTMVGSLQVFENGDVIPFDSDGFRCLLQGFTMNHRYVRSLCDVAGKDLTARQYYFISTHLYAQYELEVQDPTIQIQSPPLIVR